MKVLIVGAGQVGGAIAESLHEAHDVTVVDLDPDRLNQLSYRLDILTVPGNGASRSTLLRAGIRVTDLFIACTSRDEANIVAALQARALSSGKVIARTRSSEYLDAWRERQFDVDFMVSSEAETAQAVARAVGMPTAVQTDVFADGRVEMVEFEVHTETAPDVAGRTLADARIPEDCVVASIIRGPEVIIPGGRDRIEDGDRLVVIASAAAAHDWAQRLSVGSGRKAVEQVVVCGGGATGRAVGGLLARLGMRVRLIEIDEARARACAEDMADVEVFCADATDPEFMERENVGRADAVVCCTDADARDLLIGLLARSLGAGMAIAIVGNPDYIPIFERVGIDLALNERRVTAEEIIRFTHDPRTRAVAMLEDDRVEVLEMPVRAESSLCGKLFRERPLGAGAIVGAVVRGDRVLFPRGDDSLQGGDIAIIVADQRRVREIEATL